MEIHQEVFFRPPERTREAAMLRADVYNRCRLALTHSLTDCAFVPIRSMQFQAVITRDEIIFVDNLAYAVRDGEGGRVIMLAWHLIDAEKRDSLSDPVPIDIISFHDNSREHHRRVMSEFPAALDTYNERLRGHRASAQVAKVVPIRRD